MKNIIVEEEGLKELSSMLDKMKALLQHIESQAVVYEPSIIETPVIEHDAICYIRRYEDLKRVVEGKSHEFKLSWARDHYERFGRTENRIWGCREELIPIDAPDVPDIQSAPSGILWKPIAESRGGVPVLLTPSSWEQVDAIMLLAPTSDIPIRVSQLEKRGRTNSNRETYFFHGVRARSLPKNMILDVAQHGRYLVPDPTLRYE